VLLWLALLFLPRVSADFQDDALCGFVAATSIGQYPYYNGWSCLPGGTTSTDPCQSGGMWTGVMCTNGHVSTIDVDYLSGTLPSSLGLLSTLTRLQSEGGVFTGTIPPEIGSLDALVTLRLGDNRLSGTLPSSLGLLSSMVICYLFENSFTGSIPTTLCNLTKLYSFALTASDSNIGICGEYPTCWGELGGYSDVALHTCAGDTPSFQDSALCGFIAATNIASFTNYEEWSCVAGGTTSSHPCRTDAVWTGIGCTGGFVSAINVASQGIAGTLPSSLGLLSTLRLIYLDENVFAGTIPPEIGSLDALVTLRLGDNRLSGTLPSSLGLLSSMMICYLFENSFTGSIPTTLCNLTKLHYLALTYEGGNPGLCGDYPGCTSISQVQVLDDEPYSVLKTCAGDTPSFQDSALCGFIAATNIASFTNYEEWSCLPGGTTASNPCNSGSVWVGIGCTDNYVSSITAPKGVGMSGTLPAVLGSLTTLFSLDLSASRLTGPFPRSLAEIPVLGYVDVSSSGLTGHLPYMPGLSTLRLIDTALSGPLGFCPSTALFIENSNIDCIQCPSDDQVAHSARLGCTQCPAGRRLDPEIYRCHSCPIGTYMPKVHQEQPENEVCVACAQGRSTATVGSTGPCYFQWVQDPSVVIGVLAATAAVYAVCFLAAGEKSLAIALNMLLPMADHLTDTQYVMAELFFTYDVFYAAMAFLLLPCVVFVYELAQSGDWPSVWMPRHPPGGSAFGWVLVLIWAELSIPLLLVWFVVGSFLYNSRMLAVGRVRRLWFYVWRGFVDKFERAPPSVDTEVLNRILFSGFVLESAPQLVIQSYNAAQIGASVNAQFSIAISALMTFSSIYKFVYWRYVRGLPWKDIPVAPLIPNISALSLDDIKSVAPAPEMETEAEAGAASPGCGGGDEAEEAGEEKDWQENAKDEVAAGGDLEEAKEEEEGGTNVDDTAAGAKPSAFRPVTPTSTLFEVVFWLQPAGAHGEMPTYRGLPVFATFEEHDDITKFTYLCLLWLSCVMLQLYSIWFSPLWVLCWLLNIHVEVVDVQTARRGPDNWLLTTHLVFRGIECVVACALVPVLGGSAAILIIVLFYNSVFCAILFSRLFRDHWFKQFVVNSGALTVGSLAAFAFSSSYWASSGLFYGGLIPGGLLAVMDTCKELRAWWLQWEKERPARIAAAAERQAALEMARLNVPILKRKGGHGRYKK